MQERNETISCSSTILKTLKSVESTTKWAYKALLSRKLIDQCSCEPKWNDDVGAVPDWSRLTKRLIVSTKNIELRWFQFRIWHRILPTRKMLKIFKIIDDDRCVFCHQSVETALHLIIICPKVKAFWDQIWIAFKRGNITYRATRLTKIKMLFGVNTGENYDLNLFLLLAKWFIWKQSKADGVLSIRLFLNHLSMYESVQSCVYNMMGKKDKFRALWNATANMMNVLNSA